MRLAGWYYECCYGPTTGTTFSTDLLIFLPSDLILSFRLQTMKKFSMRTHLSHALHIFTYMCLPHGKPYAIKLNFIVDSSFPCYAWLCCHTHAHHTYSCFSSILPLPCSCLMLPYLDMPFFIDRFNINMYIHYNSI